MSSAVEWLEIWSTPRPAEADSLDIFVAYVAAHVVVSLLFYFFCKQVHDVVFCEMLLLCYAVARTTKKQKGWDIPSGFLDWTLLGLFLLLSFLWGREGVGCGGWGGEKRQRALKTQTQRTHRFFRLQGRSSTINYRACNLNRDTLLRNSVSGQFRTCAVGILAEIKGFPNSGEGFDLVWHLFQWLPGCVHREGRFEILHSQLGNRPQQKQKNEKKKPSRKVMKADFTLHLEVIRNKYLMFAFNYWQKVPVWKRERWQAACVGAGDQGCDHMWSKLVCWVIDLNSLSPRLHELN